MNSKNSLKVGTQLERHGPAQLYQGTSKHLSLHISAITSLFSNVESIDYDGKSLVYVEAVSNSKLMHLENPFIWEYSGCLEIFYNDWPETISHYKILDKLGGGWGVAHKSEDAKVKRTVALRFLSHRLKETETM